MILHGFRSRSSKNMVFLSTNAIFNQKTDLDPKDLEKSWKIPFNRASLRGPWRSRWIIDTLSLFAIFTRFLTTFLNGFLLIVLLLVFFSFLLNFLLFLLELLYLVCFSKCYPLQTYTSFTLRLFLFCLFFLLSLFYLLRLFLKLLSLCL